MRWSWRGSREAPQRRQAWNARTLTERSQSGRGRTTPFVLPEGPVPAVDPHEAEKGSADHRVRFRRRARHSEPAWRQRTGNHVGLRGRSRKAARVRGHSAGGRLADPSLSHRRPTTSPPPGPVVARVPTTGLRQAWPMARDVENPGDRAFPDLEELALDVVETTGGHPSPGGAGNRPRTAAAVAVSIGVPGRRSLSGLGGRLHLVEDPLGVGLHGVAKLLEALEHVEDRLVVVISNAVSQTVSRSKGRRSTSSERSECLLSPGLEMRPEP